MAAMTAIGSTLEAALRRDRLVFLAGLTLVVALSAAWIVSGAGMSNGMMMEPAVWTPTYALLMVAMWAVMMVAMMLPSAAPMLLLYLKVARNNQATAAPLAPASFMAFGYVLAWCGFSVAATAAQWALEQARLLSPMLATTDAWLGAGILIAAGAWQLTPIKAACLRHCRSPIGFLSGHWRPGNGGAFRMGLAHGAYCLGCCWFLMALLFFGGVMNLYWIAGLAAFVLLEKTLPYGHWLGRLVGVGLVVWGGSMVLI